MFPKIGDEFTEHYQFKKVFYGLSDITTFFQQNSDTVLEFEAPFWLDDIICVTNGTVEDHEQELREILSKLQDAGYRGSEQKAQLFKSELTWLRYYIDGIGVEPITNKTKAITKLKARNSTENHNWNHFNIHQSSYITFQNRLTE